MNIYKILMVVFLFIFTVGATVSCDCDSDDDDDDDDDDEDDDCEGEPDSVPGEPYPNDDVWQPSPGTSWQWQLSGQIDTSFDVDMYDVDLFDVPSQTIEALHDDGRVVICYFSAGSFEDWREDAGQFPDEALGNSLEGWEGERWLDVRNEEVRQIMQNRLDLAVEKGCDGVEPDNMDGYTNNPGFDYSATDQIEYNRFIADQAHIQGLSVGLKNDLCQLGNLLDWFDWALNEECHDYGECDVYTPFFDADKAVFNAEYVDDWSDAQDKADEVCGQWPMLDTIIKEWDLTSKRVGCDD